MSKVNYVKLEERFGVKLCLKQLAAVCFQYTHSEKEEYLIP